MTIYPNQLDISGRYKILHNLHYFSFCLFVLIMGISILTAPACAADIPSPKIITDDSVVDNNDYIIPVNMVDGYGIFGYVISVENNIPGVSIMIDESGKSTDGLYAVNSKDDNSYQSVGWISSTGITVAESPLFSLRVKITDSSVSEVPIKLIVNEIDLINNTLHPIPENIIIERELTLSKGVVGKVYAGSITELPERVQSSPVSAATTVPTAYPSAGNESISSDVNTITSSSSEPIPSEPMQTPTEQPISSSSVTPISNDSQSLDVLISSENIQSTHVDSPGFGCVALISLCFAGSLWFRRKMS